MELSSCCKSDVVWTSYNLDRDADGNLAFPGNEGKVDHFSCSSCGKKCEVTDENGQVILTLWED